MVRHDSLIIRIYLLFAFVIMAVLALGFRMYHVQIRRHQELYRKAREKYTAVKPTRGKRGEIYDYYGNLLVGNEPCFDISADPQIVGKREACRKIAEFFSARVNVPVKTIYSRLMRKKRFDHKKKQEIPIRYAVIANKVDFEAAEKIKSETEKMGFKGISFTNSLKRYYPKNELLANILGFTNVGKDRAIAVIGIEKFYNQEITPTRAKTMYERSRDGYRLSYGKTEVENPSDGLNVYLTIKEPIQSILEEELDKLVEQWNPKAAYAVMADPYTGDILAIAQRPTFNPNNRKTMNSEAWRNRIAEDIFEPGSTMKPIAISGALDYGIVTPDEKFYCEKGRWLFAGRILRDSHPHEFLSVSEIIKLSSNIGTAKIAIKMGENRLYQTLRRFGFGKKTGIPLKPETCGIFRHVKNWDSLSISRFPIGQGIAVSPLQLVRAYCALGNGGNLVKLRLVDRLEDPATHTSHKVPYEVSQKVFFRKDTHQKIIDMMKRVTQEGGTATRAAIEGYEVAGKTGTSQKVINGRYSHTRYFASFIGFVPAENPAFVLLVTADEPQRNYYGGVVSAPTFKNIASRTLRYLNVKPHYWLAKNDEAGSLYR